MASERERDRRYSAIRAAMAAAGIDVLLVVSDGHHKGDVLYLTDHAIWSQRGYAVMTGDAGPFLIVSMASQDFWARRMSWARDVRWSATPIVEAISVIRSVSGAGATLGVSGLHDRLPVTEHERLQAELPGVTIRDATALVQSVRARKSAEEIDQLEESARIAAAGFDRLRDVARAGVSEFELVGEVEKVVRSRGAGSTLPLTSEGPYLRSPSARTLRKGDFQMFSVELCGPSGYWVELGGIIAVGGLGDEAATLYDAAQRALDAGLRAARVGARTSDVAKAIAAVFEASGVSAGIWGGHGIGLDTLEAPRLTASDTGTIVDG
ncbi:MAG: aminopeptidase P family protein, partial [Chloroflexota bacterium]|nr:aminopeptidase P family protein [Chloroflexota bacterium]